MRTPGGQGVGWVRCAQPPPEGRLPESSGVSERVCIVLCFCCVQSCVALQSRARTRAIRASLREGSNDTLVASPLGWHVTTAVQTLAMFPIRLRAPPSAGSPNAQLPRVAQVVLEPSLADLFGRERRPCARCLGVAWRGARAGEETGLHESRCGRVRVRARDSIRGRLEEREGAPAGPESGQKGRGRVTGRQRGGWTCAGGGGGERRGCELRRSTWDGRGEASGEGSHEPDRWIASVRSGT